MQKLKTTIRTCILYALAVMLVGSSPMAVMAQESPALATTPESSATTEAPATTTTQTRESDYERWLRQKAREAAREAELNAANPTPAPVVEQTPEVVPDSTVTKTLESPTSTEESSKTIAPTASGEESTLVDIDNESKMDVDTEAWINNKLTSDASTGDAGVRRNTTAGSATTGDALAETTFINTMHSSVQGENAGIAHFTADINGDVNGDIMLYPAISQATSGGTSTTSIKNDSVLNVDNEAGIHNDITLSATSGNADVTGNTTAGDATTGDAHAVANVINLINSIIAANKSFIGTINIYGNLNGDILISPEFIPQLIASNADDHAQSSTTIENTLEADLNNSQSIINNIALSAQTGDATVSRNTNAGSATTGDAATNLTVLNLTGREVVAANSLLVFVNVLGTWVGMIVDAPVGATAAALGSGVTSTSVKNNQVVTGTNTSTITNDISLAAQTGNALVTGNTTAGNARTGNATASANIVNIDTSVFSLTDWFGVLFINVYGQWIGSFGVDTEAGTMVPIGGMAAPPQPNNFATEASAPAIRFGFVPHGTAKTTVPLGGTVIEDDGTAEIKQAMATLAAARNDTPRGTSSPVVKSVGATSVRSINPIAIMILVSAAGGLAVTMLVGLTRRVRGTLAQY